MSFCPHSPILFCYINLPLSGAFTYSHLFITALTLLLHPNIKYSTHHVYSFLSLIISFHFNLPSPSCVPLLHVTPQVSTYLWALYKRGDRHHSSLACSHWRMFQRPRSHTETVPDGTYRSNTHWLARTWYNPVLCQKLVGCFFMFFVKRLAHLIKSLALRHEEICLGEGGDHEIVMWKW